MESHKVEDAAVASGDELVACPNCAGSGLYGGVGTSSTCPVCRGTGEVDREDADGFDQESFYATFDWADYDGWTSIQEFKYAVFEGAVFADRFNQDLFDLREEAAPDVDWSELRIRDADLSGLDFAGSDFSRCDLANISFARADLSDCTFDGADLRNVDFTGTDLTRASFTEASVDATFTAAKLEGTNFDGATIHDVDFTRCALVGISLRESELGGVDFAGLDLHDTNFSRAELKQISFTGANLRGAAFIEADLEDVDFGGADLTSANFTGARLCKLNLESATSLSGARFLETTGLRFADKVRLQRALDQGGASYDDSVRIFTAGLAERRPFRSVMLGWGPSSERGTARQYFTDQRWWHLVQFRQRAQTAASDAEQRELAWLALVEVLEDELYAGSLRDLPLEEFAELLSMADQLTEGLARLGYTIRRDGGNA